MKKTIALLTLGILIGTTSTFASGTLFSDLPENEWYTSAVLNLSNKNIIKGFEDGTFRGDQQMTRAEMAVMMDRLLNYIEENSDLKDYYISEEFGLKFIKNDRFYTYAETYDGPIETELGIGKGYNSSETERIQFYHKDKDQSIESAILALVEDEGKNPDDCVVKRREGYITNNAQYFIDLKNTDIQYTEEELDRIQEANEQAEADGGPFDGEWMKTQIYNERRMEVCSDYADARNTKNIPSYFEYNDYVAKDRFIYLEESYDPEFYDDWSFEFLRK